MAANAPLPKAANAQAAKKGIVIATYRFVGHIVLSSKTPIKSWQDIQRKKVRTWDGGPIAEATVKALGGQPAFDPAPATAGDLQSGVLDQAFGSLQFAGVSLSDSARYSVYADGLAGVAQAFVVNEQLWNSLSAAFRDVITKDAKKELVDGFYSANDAAEQKAIQAITSKGGSVDHLSDADVRQMRSRTAPVWRQFRNTIGGGLMDQLKQP
jgi:TRAP-type C4-dicarboxylate transport system substrate-binding protein